MADARVRQILQDVFPDEAALLGEEVLDELIEANVDEGHLELEGRDKFDLAPVYEYLKAAATFVKKAAQDYDAWKIRHSTTKFSVEIDKAKLNIETADPAIKAQLSENLPALIDAINNRIARDGVE